MFFVRKCEPNAILIDCSDFKTDPFTTITFTTTTGGTPSEQMLSTSEPNETTEGSITSTAKSKTKFPIIWLIVIVIVVVLGFATILGFYAYIQLKKKHYNEDLSVTNQSAISSTGKTFISCYLIDNKIFWFSSEQLRNQGSEDSENSISVSVRIVFY